MKDLPFTNQSRTTEDVKGITLFEPREELNHVLETIKLVQKELGERLPLIGFAGAPFTLSSYAIEGGPSNNYAKTKAFMYEQPKMWHELCEKFSTVVSDYLIAQVEAGVQVVQLFDSWVGTLSEADYREFALPHTKRILSTVETASIPIIHFGTETSTLLTAMAEAGGDVIGVDWRISIDEAWSRIGKDKAVQGNLNPTLLLGPVPQMLKSALEILQRVGKRPGHIFNLGHGILPNTPVEHVQELAQFVHQWK